MQKETQESNSTKYLVKETLSESNSQNSTFSEFDSKNSLNSESNSKYNQMLDTARQSGEPSSINYPNDRKPNGSKSAPLSLAVSTKLWEKLECQVTVQNRTKV